MWVQRRFDVPHNGARGASSPLSAVVLASGHRLLLLLASLLQQLRNGGFQIVNLGTHVVNFTTNTRASKLDQLVCMSTPVRTLAPTGSTPRPPVHVLGAQKQLYNAWSRPCWLRGPITTAKPSGRPRVCAWQPSSPQRCPSSLSTTFPAPSQRLHTPRAHSMHQMTYWTMLSLMTWKRADIC